jgi:membrane protein implicated in regulation of membrane protease activity
VWGLSTLLTLMFVAAIVPVWAQLLVWAVGTFTVLVGFYAFFLARPRPRPRPQDEEEER